MLRQAALALLALCFSSVAWSQQPPEKAAPPNQFQATDQEKKPGTDQQAPAPPAITVNVLPTPKTESEKEEERQEKHEKAELDRRLVELTGELAEFTHGLFIATVALCVVTFCTILVLFWQGRQMKRTVELARDEFNATHRPELAVRETFWAMQDMDGGEIATDDSIMFTLVNRGRNSCTIVESAFQLTSGAFSGRTIRTRRHNHLGRIDFAVGQFRTLNYEIVSEEENFTAGARTLGACFFRGTIIYEDVAQVRRRLIFSRVCERGSDRFVPTDDPEDEYAD